MRKKVFTKIIIILLVIQTGMLSSIPLVVCFEKGGHAQLEIKKNAIHSSHLEQCSTKNNKLSDISLNNNVKNECNSCYDIPVLLKFIANTRVNKFFPDQSSFLLNYSPIFFIQKRIFKEIRVFHQSLKSYNTILQKMSFLI